MKNIKPKGYLTNFGYMGLINGEYHLFSTEQEYLEKFKEVFIFDENRSKTGIIRED